ncbi:unnamed protein product, partial [Ectocarpus sp. 6 AP-2014]
MVQMNAAQQGSSIPITPPPKRAARRVHHQTATPLPPPPPASHGTHHAASSHFESSKSPPVPRSCQARNQPSKNFTPTRPPAMFLRFFCLLLQMRTLHVSSCANPSPITLLRGTFFHPSTRRDTMVSSNSREKSHLSTTTQDKNSTRREENTMPQKQPYTSTHQSHSSIPHTHQTHPTNLLSREPYMYKNFGQDWLCAIPHGNDGEKGIPTVLPNKIISNLPTTK